MDVIENKSQSQPDPEGSSGAYITSQSLSHLEARELGFQTPTSVRPWLWGHPKGTDDISYILYNGILWNNFVDLDFIHRKCQLTQSGILKACYHTPYIV